MKHGNNIEICFCQGELELNSVCRCFRQTANDGKFYNAKYYNLDMIIAIGYRVGSNISTKV